MKGFFLSGEAYDAAAFSMFLFQMVFMDTTATIPTGSMAERWSFKSFMVYGILVGAVIYPLYANWVWGGGWLAKLGSNFNLGHGHVDFAGSSVVHMTGGVLAFMGAKMLGPRLGKFTKDGTPNAMPGHHIPMAIVGCFILAFGWFGFNAGSTLSGTDLRIGVVAVNTMLASAGGAFASTLYMWFRYGKPDISMAANGFLAGLVAITAPCAFVTAPVAVLIGSIAGILLCWAVFFVERTLKIDDPVGAISVHGVNGAWGVLSLGLFADGTYGDGWNGVPGTVKGLLLRGRIPVPRAMHRDADEHRLRRGHRLRRLQAPGRDDGAAGRPRARGRRARSTRGGGRRLPRLQPAELPPLRRTGP